MKIIKRNGEEATFDREKIITAILKANSNDEVPRSSRLDILKIREIAEHIEDECEKSNHERSVEMIQDMVEKELMKAGAFDLAKIYITHHNRVLSSPL